MRITSLLRQARQWPQRFQQALQYARLRERTFDEALLKIDDCVQILDRAGRLLWMNDSGWRRVANHSHALRPGESWLDLWDEDCRHDARAAMAGALAGEGARFTGKWACASTSWDVALTALARNDHPSRQLLAIARDVSAYVALSDERWALLSRERQARVDADRHNRNKDYALLAAAHELGAPMYAVRGWTQLLQMEDCAPAQRHEAIEAIGRNTDRQYDLVDQLLEVARFQSGRGSVTLLANSISEIIDEAVQNISAAARSKRIAVRTELRSEAWVLADFDQLQRAVSNLLFNAIKFTPQGGTITVRCVSQATSVRLEVTDTGVGITEAQLADIFEPYRRRPTDRSTPNSGFGVGLSIVRGIVHAHKGTVRASSAGAGLGATFTMILPVTTAVPSVLPAAVSAR